MAVERKPSAVARAPGIVGLGAASALAWFLDARAFVPTGRAASHFPAEVGLAPRGAAAPRHAAAAPAYGGTSCRRASLSVGPPSAAFGGLLLGAAAVRRLRAGAVARRVTQADIDKLTIKDVPAWFRKKISIGMARRGAYVDSIREVLDETYFMMAFNKDGMDCDTLSKARAMFPETVIVRGLKNSLVKKAMERTEWEGFSRALRGSNMYVFCKSDVDLKPTVQAYLKFEKDFRRADAVAKVYENLKQKNEVSFQLKPLVGGCIREEWKLIPPEEFAKLKDFPTKTELIARIAGSIKQVTQKIAVGVKQVPQKLAIGTKKVVEKMEEDGKDTVGAVVA